MIREVAWTYAEGWNHNRSFQYTLIDETMGTLMDDALVRKRTPSAWGPRSIRRFLAIVIAITGTLVTLFATASLWYVEHNRQIAQAERGAALQSELELIGSQLSAKFTALTVVMEAVRERLVAQGTADGLHDYLTRIVRTTPGFRTILVTDRQGVVRSDLRPGQPAQGLDLTHRDHVRRHLDDTGAVLYVGTPIRSRVDGEVTLPLSVPGRRHDGDLVGVVTGAINPAFMMAKFDVSHRGLDLFLVHDDGTVFGHPPTEAGEGAFVTLETILGSAPDVRVLSEHPVAAPGLVHDVTPEGALPMRLMVVGPDDWIGGIKTGSILFASSFFLVASSLVMSLALVTSRFVIQQRRARDEVARVTRSLREAERLSKIGTWTHTPGSSTVDWSKGTFEIFGVPYRELSGVLGAGGGTIDRNWYFSRIHPEDRPGVEAKIQASILTGAPYSDTYRVYRMDDDRLIFVRSDAFVEVDETGATSRISGLVQDITEDIETYEALERARGAAEAGMQVREDFIAMVSHEIRTPLNAILGFSSLIANPPVGMELTEGRRRGYIENLEQATRSILGLVEQVLNMTRLRTGEATPTIERLQVSAIVDRVVMICQASMQLRGITVDHDVDADVWILCDAPMIDRALLNVLSNAEKFSPEGGAIAIALATDGQYAHLSIKDKGPGIPPADLERLAQPFVRLEQPYSYRTQGAGLGLAIAKLILERHGGALRISSTLGEGTTVTLVLPTEPMSSADDAQGAGDLPDARVRAA